MHNPCPHCGHKLWSVEHSIGAFRSVVYFDDDELSDSYAEHIARCPGCEIRIKGALEPPGAMRRGMSTKPAKADPNAMLLHASAHFITGT